MRTRRRLRGHVLTARTATRTCLVANPPSHQTGVIGVAPAGGLHADVPTGDGAPGPVRDGLEEDRERVRVPFPWDSTGGRLKSGDAERILAALGQQMMWCHVPPSRWDADGVVTWAAWR
jgi:hypothetical protein